MNKYDNYFKPEMNSLELWGIYSELVKKADKTNDLELSNIKDIFYKVYITTKERERQEADKGRMTSY